MNNAAVTLSNVGQIYNKNLVVDNLSLTIEEGEIVGLLGPNGAGKSTTIRMLITLTKPNKGKIEVAGYDVSRHRNLVKRSIVITSHYMEEVEFLCERSGNGKPGRIGIMDTGKLIGLGTQEQFRTQYGKAIALKQTGDQLESQFFPDTKATNAYLESWSDKSGVMIRDSNLEDIFVELTGHQLN